MVLGVDVGGTKVAVAAVDGVTATRTREHPTVTVSSDALLDGVEHVVRDVISDAGQPDAIGVGVPSQIEFATGTVETSVNIPLAGVPLREELGRRFGVPVYVDNDANCAALAEAHMVGVSHLVMLTLGTGVGGGVVIDGMTFRGAHGLGAELGHIAVNSDGPPCPGNCPNRGCLEAYCSGQALERDGTELASDKPDSHLAERLGPDGRLSARKLVAAADDGDGDALLIMENFGAHARHRHRELREHLRAHPARDRRRALPRLAPLSRPRRPGGGRPDASRAVEAGNGRSGRGRRGRRRDRRRTARRPRTGARAGY